MGLPTNPEIAHDLRLLGDLLELEGASRHRVFAYRRAAARLNATVAPVAQMALDGTAAELPDIGATLQAKIAERATTGHIAALEAARARVPEGLAAVARVPGLGPKRAVALWSELAVEDLAGLRAAAESGGLRTVRGLGSATERTVLEALSAPAAPTDTRWPLGRALPIAEELAADLAGVAGVERVEVAGSLRRGVESVRDLDLVAATEDLRALAASLAEHPAVAGAPVGAQRLIAPLHGGPRLELAACPPARFGNLLQHATGSASHNVRLRERATRAGLSVSEHGIRGPDGTARHADEAAVYAALGLDWIPPELREDRGEIALAAAGELPALVSRADLLGDLHVHTDWSDGADSPSAMVEAAAARGLQYVAISDHSRSLAIAGGLSVERLGRQRDAIRAAQERHPGVQVLHATEVDILADGTLDFPDEVLAGLDWVTASVHSSFRAGRARMTERLVRAAEHPLVDAIGHPTGRMRDRRPSSDLDLPRLFEAAARAGTYLEINAQPRRLDLDDAMARAALGSGARLVIGSDAHSADAFDLIRFGVLVARRAGARPGDIANSRPWAELGAERSARLG